MSFIIKLLLTDAVVLFVSSTWAWFTSPNFLSSVEPLSFKIATKLMVVSFVLLPIIAIATIWIK